ncbi:Hsp20/alpha crystallin family protein [Pedobacter sp. Du54]|uniref:Hsp20/alpha crystallin family protein n=1 Tax=Pedobacter anseongensis TaxID=3133439 RepID=UPI0030AD347C
MKTLVKTNPFPSWRSMMEDFWNVDSFFNKPMFNGSLLPAVNVRDLKDGYQLEVSAPGFKKDDFNVSIENGMLTISADNVEESKQEKEDYTRKEFSRSSFQRSFTLPDNIDEGKIKAKYEDGLLHISLKKSDKALKEAKKVKID